MRWTHLKELVVWGTSSSNLLVVVGLRGLWGARSEIAPVTKVALALGADIDPWGNRAFTVRANGINVGPKGNRVAAVGARLFSLDVGRRTVAYIVRGLGKLQQRWSRLPTTEPNIRVNSSLLGGLRQQRRLCLIGCS